MQSLYEKHVFPIILDSMMTQAPLLDVRRKLLMGIKGDVLDVGIGTGANLLCYPSTLSKLSVTSKSSPLSAKALLRAKERDIELNHIITPASPWPIEDNSFDTVVMCMTLCSVSEETVFLLEIKRILRSKGVVLFMEHSHSPDSLVNLQERLYNPLNKIIGCGCSMKKSPLSLLVDSGFKVSLEHKGYLPKLHKVGGYLVIGKARLES